MATLLRTHLYLAASSQEERNRRRKQQDQPHHDEQANEKSFDPGIHQIDCVLLLTQQPNPPVV